MASVFIKTDAILFVVYSILMSYLGLNISLSKNAEFISGVFQKQNCAANWYCFLWAAYRAFTLTALVPRAVIGSITAAAVGV